MKNKFQPLKSGEVICVANPVQFVSPNNTFRVSELAEALKQELVKYSGYGVTEEDLAWLSPEGSDCAVLKFGAPGWQKGKLRLKIEFCPDDSNAAYSADDEYEDDSEASVSKSLQPQATPTPTSEFKDNNDDLDSVFDDFSNDPELDFIAESATLLEFGQPESDSSIHQKKPSPKELDADFLSQSIEQELNQVRETEEDDPFAEPDDADFPDSLGDDEDDDDNFGFGELGLDEDFSKEENSEFDTVWQDL